MARLSSDDNDKALWLTLAQSWVRLAEHVARGQPGHGDATVEHVFDVQSRESA
jgi:hypothetical protein